MRIESNRAVKGCFDSILKKWLIYMYTSIGWHLNHSTVNKKNSLIQLIYLNNINVVVYAIFFKHFSPQIFSSKRKVDLG